MNRSITGKISRFFNQYGLRLIGIVAAVFLYLQLDIISLWHYIKKADIIYLLSTIISVNIVVLLQAWRGYILLDKEREKINWISYARLYFVTMSASATLPGRIGAVAQVPLMKQRGVKISTGVANVLYDKLCDLAGFLAMGAMFSMIISESLAVSPAFLMMLSFITFVFIWYLDVMLGFASRFIGHLFSSFPLDAGGSGIRLRISVKITALFLTLLRLSGAVVVHYFGALAAGLNPPMELLAAASAFGALATLLPISIMGVGFREGIFLLLFSGQGWVEEQILTFAVLILLSYLSTVLIGTITAVTAKRNIDRHIS